MVLNDFQLIFRFRYVQLCISLSTTLALGINCKFTCITNYLILKYTYIIVVFKHLICTHRYQLNSNFFFKKKNCNFHKPLKDCILYILL